MKPAVTRRNSLLTLGAGMGAGLAANAWRERQGLTRVGLPPDALAQEMPGRLHALLAAAALAPSGHNTQPWTVRLQDTRPSSVQTGGVGFLKWTPPIAN